MTSLRMVMMVVTLIVALMVIGFLYARTVPLQETPSQNNPRASKAQPAIPATSSPVEIPPLSAVSAEVLEKSHGFQVLVSFTDRGFEPSDITVQKGATIRFTNNSKTNLHISASGDPLYPAGPDGCSASAFDSCVTLAPHDFWEFTFDAFGAWSYKNDAGKGTGIVRVK